MIGDWKVVSLPRCTHHVFLSHCAEDRERLVHPVFQALESQRYAPWLDRHHYPAGRGAHDALREGIAHCRHVAYFVNASFLAQGRGWNSVENAYADLLQVSLRFSTYQLCAIHLPLAFVPPTHDVLRRSAWGPLLDRARFYPHGRVGPRAVEWAAGQIAAFIAQEEKRGASLAEQVENDPEFRRRLRGEPNLLRRVMHADPPQLEAQPP